MLAWLELVAWQQEQEQESRAWLSLSQMPLALLQQWQL
jgi:hypothetical protein